MSAGTRTPLLTNPERMYTTGEDDHERLRGDSTDSQLTALADHLGLQPDALSGTSSERETRTKRGRNGPINDAVVTVSHEQLEELLTALDTTSDLIKQVGMNSLELENLTRRRRPHRIPKCVTSKLLLLTVFWQILNIAAVSIVEAFANQSKGDDKAQEKTIYLVSIIVIVVFQAANLILVIFTTIKLTKQIMHQTVTKSFLAQSFLSTTLLYAGLYTLVYKFDCISAHFRSQKCTEYTINIFQDDCLLHLNWNFVWQFLHCPRYVGSTAHCFNTDVDELCLLCICFVHGRSPTEE